MSALVEACTLLGVDDGYTWHERTVSLDDASEWIAALNGFQHSIVHTAEYAHALWLSTRQATFLYVAERGTERIVCPLAERSYAGLTDVFSPYGVGGFAGTTSPSAAS